jgi:hypothetical protein
MSHRVNFWHEALIDHVTEREWSQEDIAHLSHMIGHSALMSEQGVLAVLEFQQVTDERIQAEKDCDKTFGFDDMGNYTSFSPGVLERTDEVNNHFQQRFDGVN